MPPLCLLAALLVAQLQISFGQHMSDGVAPRILATQPAQNQNVTDAAAAGNLEQNLKYAKNWDQNNLNSSVTFPSGATITNVKFIRNPAYDGPAPSFSLMNNKNAPVSYSGASGRDAEAVNLQSALPTDAAPNTAGHLTSKQTEDREESTLNTPAFMSFAPRFAAAVPSQTAYCFGASPAQSSSTNMAAPQPSFSPPSNQQSHQTFSSVQYYPSNFQNPTNMRMRFVPAAATGPMQHAVPIQSAVPSYNTVPIQNTTPMQNTIPIRNTMPMQTIVDNTIQNPHLSLLLSHLFSQCPVKQEHFTPSIMRFPSQEERLTKLTVVKTLLPLLLELLTDRNSNCCDYKNEIPRTIAKYKQGSKQLSKLSAKSLEQGPRSRSTEQRHRVNENKVTRKPYDDSIEDDDYSNESSDYSDEDYDDEH